MQTNMRINLALRRLMKLFLLLLLVCTFSVTSTDVKKSNDLTSLSCNFKSQRLCDWNSKCIQFRTPFDNLGDEDKTNGPITLPPNDVPYITLKTNPKRRKIILNSKKKSPSKTENCFDFLLHALSNREDAEVQVHALASDNKWQLIWAHRRFNQDRWRSISLQIPKGVTSLRISSNIHIISLAQFNIADNVCPTMDSIVSTFEPGHTSLLTAPENSVIQVQAKVSDESLPKVDTTTRSGEGHYLTTADRQQSRVRLFTPELQPFSAYCFGMQVFMPDHNRDMIELRWPEENEKPALWTSQALFSFEQNTLENEMRKMFDLAKQQSNKLNDEDEDSDGKDGQWVDNEEEETTGAQLPPLEETTTDLNGWHRMQITIRPEVATGLEVRIQHRPSALPIALDDISIRPGKCIEEANCDFSGSINHCPVTYESTNGLIFLIGKGRLERPQKINSYQPIRSLTAEKDYAYIDFTGTKQFFRGKNRPSSVQMSTNWLQPTGRTGGCFRLIYLISKIRSGDVELSVHIQDRSGSHSLRSIKSGDFTDFTGWVELKLNVVSMERFRLGLRVKNDGGKDFAPFVAFDSMKLERDGLCPSDFDDEIDEESYEEKSSLGTFVEEISCEFDVNMCEWQNKDWKIADYGDEDILEHMPRFNEHGEFQAGFAYMDTGATRVHLQGLMTSPVVHTYGGSDQTSTYCVIFSYYLDNTNELSGLQLSVKMESQHKLVYRTRQYHSSYNWQRVRRTFHVQSNSFSLELEGWSKLGTVAVGGLSVYSGHCAHLEEDEIMCDFEEAHGCPVRSSFFSENPFKLYLAQTLDHNQHDIEQQPMPIDHSSQSSNGHVMAVNFPNSYRSYTDKSELLFELRPPAEVACIRFWLSNTAGDGLNWLRLYALQAKSQNNLDEEVLPKKHTPLLTIRNRHSIPEWSSYYVQIYAPYSDWMVKFEAEYKQVTHGYIALDDIQISTQPCVQLCDFEVKCDSWNAYHPLQFIYLDEEEKVKTIHTLGVWSRMPAYGKHGPHFDATTLSLFGHFLGREDSYPAVYQSSPLQLGNYASGDMYACLNFEIYGHSDKGEGELLVMASSESHIANNINGRKIAQFDKTNLQFGMWNKIRKTIDAKSFIKKTDQEDDDPLWLIVYLIDNTKGRDSTMFLDDISLRAGKCSSSADSQFDCGNGIKIPGHKRCDFVVDCHPSGLDELNCADCEFSEGACGYKSLTTDKSLAHWEWMDAKPEYMALDIPDHQKGLFVAKNSRQTHSTFTQEGILASEYLQPTHSTCQLIVSYANNGFPFELWTRLDNGLHFPLWRSSLSSVSDETVEIHIGRFEHNFRLEFVARLPWTSPYDIALYKVQSSQCALPIANAANDGGCSNWQFQCKNLVCIDSKFLCDYVNHCGDHSDEDDCPVYPLNTNFEFGMHNWDHDMEEAEGDKIVEKFNWGIGYESLNHGPSRDHTLNTDRGHFVILRHSTPKTKTVTGWLHGDFISPSSGCVMRFHYFNSHVLARVWVVIADGKGSKMRNSINSHEVYNWNRAEMPISPSQTSEKVKISLYAEIDQVDAWLAIDDISFTEPCFPKRPESISCAFESQIDGLCEWEWSNLPNNILWEIRDPKSFSEDQKSNQNYEVPSKSPPSGKKGYLWLTSTSSQSTSTVASLSSIKFSAEKKGFYCLTMTYSMRGVTGRTLELYDEHDQSIFWRRSGDQGDEWQTLYIERELSARDRISYEIRSTMVGSGGFVAISNLDMIAGQCPTEPMGICSFDRSDSLDTICSEFAHPPLEWKYFGDSSLQLHEDHTSQVESGAQLVTTSGWLREDQYAELYVSNLPAIDQKRSYNCLQFWINTHVLKDITEIDRAWIGVTEQVEKEKYLYASYLPDSPHDWLMIQAQVLAGSENPIVIRARFESSPSGIKHGGRLLLLDDLKITPGKCASPRCSFSKSSCSYLPNGNKLKRSWIRSRPEVLRIHNGLSVPNPYPPSSVQNQWSMVTYFEPNAVEGENSYFISHPVSVKMERSICISFMYWAAMSDGIQLDLELLTSDQKLSQISKVLASRRTHKPEEAIEVVTETGLLKPDTMYQFKFNAFNLKHLGETIDAQSRQNAITILNVNYFGKSCAEMGIASTEQTSSQIANENHHENVDNLVQSEDLEENTAEFFPSMIEEPDSRPVVVVVDHPEVNDISDQPPPPPPSLPEISPQTSVSENQDRSNTRIDHPVDDTIEDKFSIEQHVNLIVPPSLESNLNDLPKSLSAVERSEPEKSLTQLDDDPESKATIGQNTPNPTKPWLPAPVWVILGICGSIFAFISVLVWKNPAVFKFIQHSRRQSNSNVILYNPGEEEDQVL